MKQIRTNGISKSGTIGRYSFLTEISKILDTDNHSKNLIIAIYLLEQNCFFYYNKEFEKILGNKLDQFYEQGWDFWFANMCQKESLMAKKRINGFLAIPLDRKLLVLSYHMYDGEGNRICVKHEMVLHKKAASTFIINYLFDISEKERIENCLSGTNGNNDIEHATITKPISPREEQVLKLIADGYSSKQIANRLFISNHTAISHRKNLIEKFQVKNTAQLIRKASKFIEL